MGVGKRCLKSKLLHRNGSQSVVHSSPCGIKRFDRVLVLHTGGWRSAPYFYLEKWPLSLRRFETTVLRHTSKGKEKGKEIEDFEMGAYIKIGVSGE